MDLTQDTISKKDLQNIENYILRVRKGKVWFFDQNGIYNQMSCENAYREGLYNVYERKKPVIEHDLKEIKRYIPCTEYIFSENVLTRMVYLPRRLTKAICNLQEGDTLDQFVSVLNSVEYKPTRKPSEPIHLKDIANCILRIGNNKAFYFNESGIYHAVSCKEAISKQLYDISCSSAPVPCSSAIKDMQDHYHAAPGHVVYEKYHTSLMFKAIKKLRVGDTLDTFVRYLNTVEFESPQTRPLPTGLQRFVTRIYNPVFEKKENCNTQEPFDYIRVEVSICHDWDNRKQYIQDNLKFIHKMVVDKIKSSRKFQKHDMSIQSFKLGNISLRPDDVLVFVYELKDV